MKTRTRARIAAIIAVPIAIGGWYAANHKGAVQSFFARFGAGSEPKIVVEYNGPVDYSDIPEWKDPSAGETGVVAVTINSGRPQFSNEEIAEAEKRASANAGETYKDYFALDSLGRPRRATAILCREGMPTEERGSIGMIRPAGWHLAKYDFIDGRYLFNRCHLVGYQLAGDNADERILITGTRFMNIHGMLPVENEVAGYLKDHPGAHVLYRATPIYKGRELLCRGIQIEALSLEDRGKGLSINTFCYNVQPGVVIDYATGDNHAAR